MSQNLIVFYKKSSEKGYIFGTLLGCIVLSNLQILQNGTPILQSPSLSFIRKIAKKATFSHQSRTGATFGGGRLPPPSPPPPGAPNHPFCTILHPFLGCIVLSNLQILQNGTPNVTHSAKSFIVFYKKNSKT